MDTSLALETHYYMYEDESFYEDLNRMYFQLIARAFELIPKNTKIPFVRRNQVVYCSSREIRTTK